ncbi:YkgJ family cysteine cluster protein [Vibrio alginolyticus]|uniref:YkgJ family cysteine cluster protein n=1 Tax=Vibrio parahaemolyticus TaxID=670 RepID=UPI00193E755B|nr:YkgJ family cysteine cluster protein [Vibrio alginolyticus]MBM5066986.1 YkgJ family cysteine cluster protein [Vibrio parahaemolyticus]HCZ9035178.1 YkgJ family cysteine cluster protein [Vibrio alginolyticus]HCZ9053741.1 YkgJ family cysteine cluster protein [Vibrio alginolyticus]
MSSTEKRTFPCDACGQCCRNVHLSNQTSYLDRGDGTCINFNDSTKLCEIYESRPLICRVEEYYTHNLSHIYKWEEFIEINAAICTQLKSEF